MYVSYHELACLLSLKIMLKAFGLLQCNSSNSGSLFARVLRLCANGATYHVDIRLSPFIFSFLFSMQLSYS